MRNLLNLCRTTIAHLNGAAIPPFHVELGKNDGEMFITSRGGQRVARIWLQQNEKINMANAKLIVNSLNNCHRFAAGLGIALKYLTHEEIAIPEIEKCFENEKINIDNNIDF